MRTARLIWLLFFAAMLTSCATRSACVLRPLNRCDIVGNWIGFDTDGLIFYTLQFKPTGDGTLIRIFWDDYSAVYKVEHWCLNDGVLCIYCSPIKSDEPRISVTAKYLTDKQIDMSVSEEGSTWTETISLFRNEYFLSRLNLADLMLNALVNHK